MATRLGNFIFSPQYLSARIHRTDAFSALWMAITVLGYEEVRKDGAGAILRVWLTNESNLIAKNTLLAAERIVRGVTVELHEPAHIDVLLTDEAVAELIARGLRQKAYYDHQIEMAETEKEYRQSIEEHYEQ